MVDILSFPKKEARSLSLSLRGGVRWFKIYVNSNIARAEAFGVGGERKGTPLCSRRHNELRHVVKRERHNCLLGLAYLERSREALSFPFFFFFFFFFFFSPSFQRFRSLLVFSRWRQNSNFTSSCTSSDANVHKTPSCVVVDEFVDNSFYG